MTLFVWMVIFGIALLAPPSWSAPAGPPPHSSGASHRAEAGIHATLSPIDLIFLGLAAVEIAVTVILHRKGERKAGAERGVERMLKTREWHDHVDLLANHTARDVARDPALRTTAEWAARVLVAAFPGSTGGDADIGMLLDLDQVTQLKELVLACGLVWADIVRGHGSGIVDPDERAALRRLSQAILFG